MFAALNLCQHVARHAEYKWKVNEVNNQETCYHRPCRLCTYLWCKRQLIILWLHWICQASKDVSAISGVLNRYSVALL